MRELSGAAKKLPNAVAVDQREHLLRRCFFFFGILRYRKSEFAFSQGFIFLNDLWAEGAVSTIINAVIQAVPLSDAQEAVLHRWFSDVARAQKDETPAADDRRRAPRTLYDLEQLLLNRTVVISPEQRELQGVFDAVKDRFAAADVIAKLARCQLALDAVIEYEFTEMFTEFYRDQRRERGLPEYPPGFDRVTGESATWEIVESIIRELQAAPP